MPNIQVGTFVLNIELLVYLAAGALGAMAVHYRQRGRADREKQASEAWNAVFLWLIAWKGSLFLFDPESVIRHPLSLVFFSGGTRGVILASVVSLAYLVMKNIRRSGSLEAFKIAGTWGSGAAAAAWLGTILLTDSAGAFAYAGLSASAVLLAFLASPTPKAAARALGVALVAGMAIYAVFDPKDGRQARVAEAAPDVELTDLEGNAVRLSDYKGRTVVLSFWATWCKVCQAEMPHVEKLYQEYRDKDVVILSVNSTTQERSPNLAAEYADKEKLSFPIVLDERGEAIDRYGVTAYPTTYVVDPSGHIRSRYLGAISYEGMKNAVRAASENGGE